MDTIRWPDSSLPSEVALGVWLLSGAAVELGFEHLDTGLGLGRLELRLTRGPRRWRRWPRLSPSPRRRLLGPETRRGSRRSLAGLRVITSQPIVAWPPLASHAQPEVSCQLLVVRGQWSGARRVCVGWLRWRRFARRVNLTVVTDVGRMGVKMGKAAKKSGAGRARLGNVAHIKRSRAPGHSFREWASRHDFFT